MKKLSVAIILLAILSLFFLFGYHRDEILTSEPEIDYDWTKDPKYADDIVRFKGLNVSLNKYTFLSNYINPQSEIIYDNRIRPDPEAVPGTLSERIGYIENQWDIIFFKEDITDPSLWETVTHGNSFKTWLETYIPYPITVEDIEVNDYVWHITVNAPSEKIPEIEATLKNLKDQRIIGNTTHLSIDLPQFNISKTESWRSAANDF